MEVDEHDARDENSVELVKFCNQAGGSSLFLRYGTNTVCKSFLVSEYVFYQSLPSQLLPFVPSLKGIIEVKLTSDEFGTGNGGRQKLVARPALPEDAIWRNSTDNQTLQSRLRLSSPDQLTRHLHSSRNVSKNHFPTGWKTKNELISPGGDTKLNGNSSGYDASSSNGNNSKSSSSEYFLLMEDLTCRRELPCILDLKMGTRQHSDSDNDFKIRLKQERCAMSTSSSLGVRLGGMKLWRECATPSLLVRNKVYGRALTINGFFSSICEFLEVNPSTFGSEQSIAESHINHKRLQLVPEILRRLQRLVEVVLTLESFRFYSSSLLIIYDAAVFNSAPSTVLNGQGLTRQKSYDSVMSYDNSVMSHGNSTMSHDNSTMSHDSSVMNHDGSKQTTIHMADSPNSPHTNRLPDTNDLHNQPRVSSFVNGIPSSSHRSSNTTLPLPDGRDATIIAPAPSAFDPKDTVDVRLIDFAHTSSSNGSSEAAVQNVGPDHGLILGLRNLITIFQCILDHKQFVPVTP